jgi:hypothetical protein
LCLTCGREARLNNLKQPKRKEDKEMFLQCEAQKNTATVKNENIPNRQKAGLGMFVYPSLYQG